MYTPAVISGLLRFLQVQLSRHLGQSAMQVQSQSFFYFTMFFVYLLATLYYDLVLHSSNEMWKCVFSALLLA